MSKITLRKFKTAAIGLAIFLAGGTVGWFAYQAKRSEMIQDLLTDTKRFAVALDISNLRQLSGTRADIPTPPYSKMKARLQDLAASDPDVRVIRVYRFVPETGMIVHLGDSARAGARNESLPGDS